MDERLGKNILGLKHPDPYERYKAAVSLKNAAFNKVDITPAIPALVDALEDGYCMKTNAIWALEFASKNGADISIAIPKLIEHFDDYCIENVIQSSVLEALGSADVNSAYILPTIPKIVDSLLQGSSHASWALKGPIMRGILKKEHLQKILKAENDSVRRAKIRKKLVGIYREAISVSKKDNPLEREGIRIREIPKTMRKRFRTGMKRVLRN